MKLLHLLRKIVYLSLWVNFLAPSAAMSQSFERGYDAYMEGRYRSAKRHFSNSLRQTRDPYDQALIYKFMGLNDYMMGDNNGATRNFQSALRLDPAIKVSRNEVRDRGAIRFFEGVKRGGGRMGGGRMGGGRDKRPRLRGSGGSGRPSQMKSPRSFRSQRRSVRTSNSFSRRRSRSRSEGSSFSFSTLLPFGIGQFSQDKTILGSAFAIGQATGLFIYLERTAAWKATDKETEETIAKAEAEGNTSSTEFLNYLDASEAFVLGARADARNGLLLFAASYGIGVMEAMFNAPSPTRNMRRPMNRRIRSDLDLKGNSDTLVAYETIESVYYAPLQAPPNGWSWSLLPSRFGPAGMVQWHMNL